MSQWCWCLEKNNWVDSERTLRVRGAIIISHHSPVSHFVSPFGWLRDGVIASLRIYKTCENLCPRGLLCVISGLLAGGSPGFRTVLCCFSHMSRMASLFVLFRFFRSFGFISPYQSYLKCKVIFFCNRAVWPYVTLQCFCLFCFGCCSVCFVWFGLVLLCFLVWSCFLFHLHRDGLLDYVLVLLQHYFCGPSLNKME